MALSIVDLDNAEADVNTIAAVANSPAPTVVTRLGDTIPTLSGLLADLNAEGVATDTMVNANRAELAADLAEAARDASFPTANVGTDLAAQRATVADGQQFSVVTGDYIIRYRRDSAATQTELARYPSKALLDRMMMFPRYRDMYGIVMNPTPTQLTNSGVNQATLTNDGRFSIPAGVGKTYYSIPSSNLTSNMFQTGDKLLFILELDSDSGTISTPNITTQPGAVVTPMVNDTGRRWIAEVTAPAGGFTSILAPIVSSDAALPVKGKQLAYSISPVSASPYFAQPDALAVQGWVQAGMADGIGNMWPAELTGWPVVAADSGEDRTQFGIQVAPGERLFAMAYFEADDGTPAIVDRAWVSVVSLIDTPASAGPSQNVFLSPIAGQPGVWAGWCHFHTLTKAAMYARVNIDNAQTVAGSYTQKAIVVKKFQLFRKPPASFISARSMMWRNEGKIWFRNYNGQQDVTLPVFAPGKDDKDYWQFQSRRYDKTGDGLGGGVGSVWEESTLARRTDDDVFQPYFLTVDGGLNEFAMKASTWSDNHQGGNVHGGQQRTAAPQLYVDDVLQADPTIQKNFGAVNKVQWIEYSQVMDRVTPATPVASVKVTKTWTGRTFTLKTETTFLQPLGMMTLYGFMNNSLTYINNEIAKGPLFDQWLMPDQGNAAYVPAGGVQAAYPAEKKFAAISNALGIRMDIEVLSATTAEFRSWIQAGGITTKLYMSPIGVHDAAGLLGEQVARATAAGEVHTLEVRMSFSKL